MYSCLSLSIFSIPAVLGVPEYVHKSHLAIHPLCLFLLLSSLSICPFLFWSLFFFPSVSFPSSSSVSTPSPSPTHSDIITHIHTLLLWHTLQRSAYHAPLKTQTHISFHNNNPASSPPPYASPLPFPIHLFLFLSLSLEQNQIVTQADHRASSHGSSLNLSLC